MGRLILTFLCVVNTVLAMTAVAMFADYRSVREQVMRHEEIMRAYEFYNWQMSQPLLRELKEDLE